jgi:hypothetical protein
VQLAAEDLDLEPTVVLRAEFGAEADLVADAAFHPLAAVDADAPDGDVLDQAGLVAILGPEGFVVLGGSGVNGLERLGHADGGAEAMLQRVGPRPGLALVGFGTSGQQGVNSMDNVAKSSLVLETFISREHLWAGSARDRRPK